MLKQNSSIKDRTLPIFITTNVPLADKNWFQTGGPAKLFATPINSEQFAESIVYAHQHKESIFLLGKGANILISDDGFDGLVIQPALTNIVHSDNIVTAGAGTSIHELINYCLSHNLLGLEEFSGIPGTVGGAVFINLHYFEFLLSQFLVSARIIHKETGIIQTVDNAWFKFAYNISALHNQPYYLVEASFKLKKSNDLETAYARGRNFEIIRHRAHKYPQSHTCGSFFRNFHPEEVTLESNNKKMIYVAYYLDKIGVKGALQSGGAIVSYQHANMIVNKDNATSADIITVAHTMQKMVKAKYGIIPQPECRLIGFKHYPLLP